MMEEKQRDLKEMILEEAKKGNVVFSTIEGYAGSPIDDFISQPIVGLLYDLNRLPEVVLTFIDDPKWVNDYAVHLVIKRLKEKADLVDELLKALSFITHEYVDHAQIDNIENTDVVQMAYKAIAKAKG
jgi:hypothetical protein